MSYKKSNPARTNLVLMVIVVSLFIVVDFLLLLMAISIYVEETRGSMDALLNAFCGAMGLYTFFPLVLLYTIVAFAVSLWGRGVYGRKHELSTFAGFFLGIGGIVSLFILPIIAFMVRSEDFAIIIIPVPMLAMVVGLYLFIKDIGGKVMGAIGLGIHSFSRVIFVLFALMWYHDVFNVEAAMVGFIFSLLISLAGLVVLLIGFVHAFQWTNLHEPLIDEQEVQQMQMQQHQLSLQQESMEMQREQLLLQQEAAHMLREQNRVLIDSGIIEEIASRSSARRDKGHFHEEIEFDDDDLEDW
ncbi:MAG: hypothetical protein ACMUHB_01280 [Thermoplasmatota archaeon]